MWQDINIDILNIYGEDMWNYNKILEEK